MIIVAKLVAYIFKKVIREAFTFINIVSVVLIAFLDQDKFFLFLKRSVPFNENSIKVCK